MSDNGKKWDANQLLTFIGVIIALLSFVVAVIAVAVTVTTPELRSFFGLKEGDTPAPSPIPAAPAQPIQQHVENTKPPSGPFSATLHENQPQFIEAAKSSLTAAFYNNTGEITAKLIITPDIKEQIILPTVGSGSKEFVSSAGVFLVHILNVDWDNRTVMVQVSKK
jgi:hypothetical protein